MLSPLLKVIVILSLPMFGCIVSPAVSPVFSGAASGAAGVSCVVVFSSCVTGAAEEGSLTSLSVGLLTSLLSVAHLPPYCWIPRCSCSRLLP